MYIVYGFTWISNTYKSCLWTAGVTDVLWCRSITSILVSQYIIHNFFLIIISVSYRKKKWQCRPSVAAPISAVPRKLQATSDPAAVDTFGQLCRWPSWQCPSSCSTRRAWTLPAGTGTGRGTATGSTSNSWDDATTSTIRTQQWPKKSRRAVSIGRYYRRWPSPIAVSIGPQLKKSPSLSEILCFIGRVGELSDFTGYLSKGNCIW